MYRICKLISKRRNSVSGTNLLIGKRNKAKKSLYEIFQTYRSIEALFRFLNCWIYRRIWMPLSIGWISSSKELRRGTAIDVWCGWTTSGNLSNTEILIGKYTYYNIFTSEKYNITNKNLRCDRKIGGKYRGRD